MHVPDQDEVFSLRTLEDVLTLARVSHLVSDEYLHPEYVRCAEHFCMGRCTTSGNEEGERPSSADLGCLVSSQFGEVRLGGCGTSTELLCFIEFDSNDVVDLTGCGWSPKEAHGTCCQTRRRRRSRRPIASN